MSEVSFFTIQGLCQRYDIKLSTVYHWIKSRGFPNPLKFGRLSRWRSEDVVTWEAGLCQEIASAPESRVTAVKVEMAKRKNARSANTAKATAAGIPEKARQNGCNIKKATIPSAAAGKIRLLPRPVITRKAV